MINRRQRADRGWGERDQDHWNRIDGLETDFKINMLIYDKEYIINQQGKGWI